MRILFVGDIVGRSGRTIVYERLPNLVRDWKLDLVVANAENSAGGFGISETIYRELLDVGIDVITLGNHAWDQKEALVFIEQAPRLDSPDQLSGRNARPRRRPHRDKERRARARRQRHGPLSWTRSMTRSPPSSASFPLTRWDGRRCHHRRFPRRGDERKTGDGIFLRRPRQPVVGTHTHVPTADLQILAGGTAYISDAGMTVTSIRSSAWRRTSRCNGSCGGFSGRFEPASGPATLCAVALETDAASGLASRVAAVRLGGARSGAAVILGLNLGLAPDQHRGERGLAKRLCYLA